VTVKLGGFPYPVLYFIPNDPVTLVIPCGIPTHLHMVVVERLGDRIVIELGRIFQNYLYDA